MREQRACAAVQSGAANVLENAPLVIE